MITSAVGQNGPSEKYNLSADYCNRNLSIRPNFILRQPEEITDVVKFLVSRDGRFITSTDILVDGGILTPLMKHHLKK